AAFWGAQIPSGAIGAAFYSTAALRKTLAELVDCSIINKRTPRLTVGAANVQTGMMHYFDSRQSEITIEQIMASGALPPAFPAVYTDGEFYWDGGILSNAPIEAVFDDPPRRNSLVFGVQLWNGKGARTTINLGSAQPPEGSSIFEPSCEPHYSAATNPPAAPRHQSTVFCQMMCENARQCASSPVMGV